MVGKTMTFEATRPLLIDAKHTSSSPIVFSELLRDFISLNPEDMVELVIKNNKGIFRDVCLWCERTGNELVTSEHTSDDVDIHCIIQKGEGVRSGKQMVVVVSRSELRAVVDVLEKALAGAVLGMDVAVFFEGSGVQLLEVGYRAMVGGLFASFRTSGVEDELRRRGRQLPGEMIQLLEELGVNFFVCGPSLLRFGVKEDKVCVGKFEIASSLVLIDLMAGADVVLGSRGEFDRS